MSEPMTNDLDAIADAIGHRSDCGLHNAPAIPAGPCTCGAREAAKRVAALRAKPEAAGVGVPEGWKLVPVEPTEESLHAIAKAARRELCARAIYQMGLSAAPPAPVSPWRTMMLAELEKCRIVNPDGHHGGWCISGKNSINALFTDLGGKHDAPPVSHKDQGGGA